MFCYQKRCKVNIYFLNGKIFLAFFLKKMSITPIFNISHLFTGYLIRWFAIYFNNKIWMRCTFGTNANFFGN